MGFGLHVELFFGMRVSLKTGKPIHCLAWARWEHSFSDNPGYRNPCSTPNDEKPEPSVSKRYRLRLFDGYGILTYPLGGAL